MADYDIDTLIHNIMQSNNNTWTPLDKIPLIEKEIEKLKVEMRTFLENSDYDIPGILKESTKLYIESKRLVTNMEECKKEIEQETMAEILKSIDHHKTVDKELESVNFGINMLYDVIQCGQYMKEFENGKELQSYTRAIECVHDMLQYVETPAEGFEQLDIYENIKISAQMIFERLIHTLNDHWNDMVKYTIKTGTRKTVITLTLNVNSADVLRALDNAKNLLDKVTDFAQFLMKEVFIPIMHHDVSILTETDELVTITINYKPNFRPSYNTVISSNRALFHYLSNRLDIEFNRSNSIMKMMGNIISQEFCDTIIKECLIETIPTNILELQSYERITFEIEEFQRFLIILKFFPTDGVSMLKYVSNMDVLFADRSSQYFLETARNIMLKDLSLTMSIGVERIPEDSNTKNRAVKDGNIVRALEILDKTIPNSLFYFPRCMISKTAQELLDLLYSVMEQAVQCSDIVCKKLYFTARYILELYDAVVPYHHENYLQTIPQYVALFHNNCMYIAHNLQTLGDKWLSLMEGRQVGYPIGFIDLVPKIRELGYKHLTIHMQQQRKQILDNIRSSDLNCLVVRDVLGASAEAAVRQSLRQLQLLHNVWRAVLPGNVFTRLMATLTDMLASELVHRVVSAEDISAEMAAQLADMVSLLVQKGPQLFQNASDVDEYVKSWGKLRELVLVLRGSLKDIEARWASGGGPLADNFSTEEVRSLIKALFQNSQLRSNLLSKIK